LLNQEVLWLTQLKSLGGAAAEWVLHEPLAAGRAKIEALLAVRIVAQEGTVFIELIVPLQYFLEVFQMIAIFVDPNFVGRGRRVQLHL
jgi:hypothetical protein